MPDASAASADTRPQPPLRALVTRPRADAEALAAALAGRGLDVVIEPLIDIRFAEGPAPDLTGVQAILCTSGNGVRALARLGGERSTKLLAVGDATAETARAAGFVAVESAGGDVDDLVRLAAVRLCPAAGPLLHVAGSVAAGDLAGALDRRGFRVRRAVLYEARPATGLTAATARLIAAGGIAVALFLSPRTAAIFVRLTAAGGLGAALAATTAVSLSAAADAPLAELRWRRRVVAARPDQGHLLLALDQALAEPRRR